MIRTPRRRKVSRIGLHLPSYSRREPFLDTDDHVTIDSFSSDDDNIPFLTPDRTGSSKKSKAQRGRSNYLQSDDSFLIESFSQSPLKLGLDEGDRIETFNSPKRSQKRQCRSPLITSFPSPAKTPSSICLFRFNRPSGWKRKKRIDDPEIEAEDPSIIESYDDEPSNHFLLKETECSISTDFSPVKIDLITAAFKNDQSSFMNRCGRSRATRRKIDCRNTQSTATSLSTQSSLVPNSDFLKSTFKQIREDIRQLEYERLKFNRLSDEQKNQQKYVSMQILNMVTDANLTVIQGELVDLMGFDGTDNDETDLLLRKIRIILPKVWSEGMGLSKLTTLQLFYPLKVTRTGDETLLLDNIFWIQVEKRGNSRQAIREPVEVLVHQWDCLCQVSSGRPVPACDPVECQLKSFVAQKSKLT